MGILVGTGSVVTAVSGVQGAFANANNSLGLPFTKASNGKPARSAQSAVINDGNDPFKSSSWKTFSNVLEYNKSISVAATIGKATYGTPASQFPGASIDSNAVCFYMSTAYMSTAANSSGTMENKWTVTGHGVLVWTFTPTTTASSTGITGPSDTYSLAHDCAMPSNNTKTWSIDIFMDPNTGASWLWTSGDTRFRILRSTVSDYLVLPYWKVGLISDADWKADPNGYGLYTAQNYAAAHGGAGGQNPIVFKASHGNSEFANYISKGMQSVAGLSLQTYKNTALQNMRFINYTKKIGDYATIVPLYVNGKLNASYTDAPIVVPKKGKTDSNGSVQVYNGGWKKAKYISVYNNGWHNVNSAMVYNNGWHLSYAQPMVVSS